MQEDVKESTGQADFEALEEQITLGMEEYKVPGLAIGILLGDQEYSNGFGVTNVDNPLPVTPDTLFQIGSTTKTVTATTMMRLAEQGKVDLEAPVRQYIPEFKVQDEETSATVRVKDLFTHSAGWAGDFFIDTGWGDDAAAKYVARMAELPQVTPLGTNWSYNNAAFTVAGRVIEVVTGKTYESVVKELIFEPLGMKHSFFFMEDVMTYRFAAGHQVHPEGPKVARPWPIPRGSNAAGGISTTIPDQFRYVRFQMGDGTAADGARLLKPESLAFMQSTVYEIDKGGDSMGLSWMLFSIGGVPALRHGGGTNGQISAFMFIPEKKFALIITTNADKGAELNTRLQGWVLKNFLGLSDPEPEFIDVAEESLAEYAGLYTAMGANSELSLRDGGLYLQMIPANLLGSEETNPPPPPASGLKFTAKDAAILQDGPFKGAKVVFRRKEDGQIAWLRLGSRIATRQS
jgi:CubicO group peptidase (beta-lactamase class C family)